VSGVDRLLTADEVAELFRVTRGWIYAETRAGRIPHLRLGRYVRYRESAIREWMAQLEFASSGVRRRVPSG
jgi:excisionase family DNA binding protein